LQWYRFFTFEFRLVRHSHLLEGDGVRRIMLPFTKRPQRLEENDDDETEALTRAHVSAPLAPLETSEGEDKTTLFPRSGIPSASSFPVAAARTSIPPARSSSVSARSASGSVRPVSGSVRPVTGSVRPPPTGSVRPPTGSVRPPTLRPPPPSLPPSEMSRVTTEEPAVRHGRTPVPGRSRLGLQAGPTSLSPEVARQAAYDSAFPRRAKGVESADAFDSRSRTDSRSASVRPGERSSRDVSRSAPPSGSVYVRDQGFDRPTTGALRGRAATSTSMAGMAMSSPAHFMRPQSPFADAAGTSLMSGNPFGRPARTWAVLLAGCAFVVASAAAFIVRAGGSVADTTASFIEAPSPFEKADAPAVEAQPAAQPTMAAQPAVAAQPPVAAQPASPVPETQPGPPASALGASSTSTNNVAVVPSFVTPTPTPAPTVSVTFSPITVTPPSKPAPAARPAVAWKPPAAPAPRPVAKAAPPPSDDEPVVAKSTSKKGSKGSSAESETERKAREALEKAQLESSF
jgi:hypothetical protein